MMRPRVVLDEGVFPGRFVLAPEPNDVITRRLLFEGRGVAVLEGIEVVGHFCIDGIGWLLVVDFDCPIEETVRVYLLDAAFRLLDAVRLDQPYVTGLVENLHRSGPHSVTFSFPDPGLVHEITVEPRTIGFLRRRTRWLHLETQERSSPDPDATRTV